MARVLIVAGEKSGDNYGAALVRRTRALAPATEFFGVGGTALAAAGVERIFAMEELSHIGLVEVVRHLPRLGALLGRLRNEARARRPDAAVLIDSPDFNLRLARRLKKLGIPVLYYISPTVWAWRPGRLKTIRKSVAKMLLIFPFEREIYARAGIPHRFVGHPLIERVRSVQTPSEFRRTHGLDPARPLAVLMPGSRRGEVAFHMPVLMAALPALRRAADAQFVIVRSEDLDERFLRSFIPAGARDVTVLEGGAYEAMAAAEVVLAACGTANLEAALLGAPVVAFYRLSRLTRLLGARLIRIRHFSIVNILAGEGIIPELIQEGFTPEAVVREALRFLQSPAERARLRERFAELAGELGSEPASENAAGELLGLIQARPD